MYNLGWNKASNLIYRKSKSQVLRLSTHISQHFALDTYNVIKTPKQEFRSKKRKLKHLQVRFKNQSQTEGNYSRIFPNKRTLPVKLLNHCNQGFWKQNCKVNL